MNKALNTVLNLIGDIREKHFAKTKYSVKENLSETEENNTEFSIYENKKSAQTPDNQIDNPIDNKNKNYRLIILSNNNSIFENDSLFS